MEFIDLAAQRERIGPDVAARVNAVLAHGCYVMGPEVGELEARLADYVGVAHCSTVSSGTDALLIALMALDIGPGDEVITTPFTFVATAETIALLGAKPVFADIDRATYNLDPMAIDACVTARTKAILPVGLFGQMPAMTAINAIGQRHGLPIIEDAAQSFGARRDGQRSCGASTIGVTSFFPAKPLGCYGDGGAVFTDDIELGQCVRKLRNHGQDAPYRYSRVGINARLDTIQAAVLLAKLEVFDDEIARRARVAARYDALLGKYVQVPRIEPGQQSVYAHYTVELSERDAVRATLTEAGIPSAIYYPLPLHRQPAYATDTTMPAAEAAAARVLSLPMHPYLTERDQNQVCEALREALQKPAA